MFDNVKERFWSKVRKTRGCWWWTANKTSAGYGKVKIEGKTKLSHRVSYEFINGPIPKGLHILHHCDNPSCVRPDHLYLGTDKDNIRDMLLKNRDAMRGEKNNKAKLSWKDVNTIRRKYSDRKTELKHISKIYNVSLSTISSILLRKTWKV